MDAQTRTEAEGGPARAFASREAFRQALREAFALAAQRGCRRIWLVDPDFEHWPLDEPEVIDSLKRWGLPHRRLTLVAHHFDLVAGHRPRFVAWRRTWSHIVECRAWPREEGALPSLWLGAGLRAVRLLDPVHFRGAVDDDPEVLLQLAEACDAFSQRSEAAFPADTLGL